MTSEITRMSSQIGVRLVYLLALCFASTFAGSKNVSVDKYWGYGQDDFGPNNWSGECASGQEQSPINIRPGSVHLLQVDELVFENYNISGEIHLSNTGQSLLVQGFDNWAKQPSISGGGLPSHYDLAQFHFHWAEADDIGSEHQLGSLHYPLEAHFVHVKRGLDFKSALREKDGLAVLGVFFAKQDTEEGKGALRPIEPALNATMALNADAILFHFTPWKMLPKSKSVFYRYQGSLTTPPCSESAIWTLFSEEMFVSHDQLELMRQHRDIRGRQMVGNHRPIQPLNGRKVYMRLNPSEASVHPASYASVLLLMSSVLFYGFS